MDRSNREVDVDRRLSDQESNVHHVWDRHLDPALTVESGAVVSFDCRDATDGQVTPDTTAADVPFISPDPVHPLTGPVGVEGASPGDVLQVDIIDLDHRGWGFTLFYGAEKGAGLLPELFEDPAIHVWELEGDVGRFVNGIEIPLAPFPGIVGVAPAADEPLPTFPPRSVGGNLDIKHLTAGSTLYLPVEVADALFSIGDCHAAQGDGEVCVTGVEAPMSVTVRLSVREDKQIEQPQFETTGPFTATGRDEPMYATAGVAPDLMDATKRAIRSMIDHLHEERGLTRTEAYLLCSAAVDLKINEVVDAPNWTVSAYLPESLFPG